MEADLADMNARKRYGVNYDEITQDARVLQIPEITHPLISSLLGSD